MNDAEVHFCSAGEDQSPLCQHAPLPSVEERRSRQRLDAVTAVDVLVRVIREHHNVDVGVRSRRPSGAAADEGDGSNVVSSFGKGHKGREEPFDVLGKVRGHHAIIARGCSIEARAIAALPLPARAFRRKQ